MAGPRFLNRLGRGLAKAGIGLFQVLLVAVILIYWAGSCTAEGRRFLSCIGVVRPAAEGEIELRPPDPNDEEDRRLAASLLKLAKAASMNPDSIRIAIAKTPHINAMTIGTDTFVLCEGLAKLPEESLDAVMAHEVSHAIKKHGDRSSAVISNVAKVTDVIGTILGHDEETRREVTGWAVDAVFPPYSRAQEFEADKEAVELLRKGGYPISAVDVMCGALDLISREEGDVGGGFLSTHPAIPDRIAALRQGSGINSGPMTKEDYWAAIRSVSNQLAVPDDSSTLGLAEETAKRGEDEALKQIAADGTRALRRMQLILEEVSRITPPAEYVSLHARFISVLKEFRTALDGQTAAAKARNKKGVYEWENEILNVAKRNAEFMDEFDAEAKKFMEG